MLNSQNIAQLIASNKAFFWYLSDLVTGDNIAYYPTEPEDAPDGENSIKTLMNVLENYDDADMFKIRIFSKKGASDNRMLSYQFVKSQQAPPTTLSGITPDNMSRAEMDSLLAVKTAEFKLMLESQRLEAEKQRIKEKHAELRGIEQQMGNDLGYLVNAGKGAARELILVVLGKLFESFNKGKQEDNTPRTPRHELVECIAELIHDNRSISMHDLENFKNNLENGIFKTETEYATEQ